MGSTAWRMGDQKNNGGGQNRWRAVVLVRLEAETRAIGTKWYLYKGEWKVQTRALHFKESIPLIYSQKLL